MGYYALRIAYFFVSNFTSWNTSLKVLRMFGGLAHEVDLRVLLERIVARIKPVQLLFVCGFAILIAAKPSVGQNLPAPAVPNQNLGINLNQVYDGQHEDINLATGNLSLELHLVKLPGRHGHDLDISFSYNSQIWRLVPNVQTVNMNGNTGTETFWKWSTASDQAQPNATGWFGFGQFPAVLRDLNVQVYSFHDSAGRPAHEFCDTNFRLIMPDGSTHRFPGIYQNCYLDEVGAFPPPFTNTPVGDTDDQDPLWMRYDVNAGLFAPGGDRWVIPGYEDANGNIISTANSISGNNGTTSYTDTVGRSVQLPHQTATGPNFPNSILYKDSNGVTETITVNYLPAGTLTTTGSFSNPPPVASTNQPNTYAMAAMTCSTSNPCQWQQMLSSIVLPNGLTYTFHYNNTFGELDQITYPSGGYTRYEYATFQRGISSDMQGPETPMGPWDFRELVAKHVCRAAVVPRGTLTYTVTGTVPTNTCPMPEDTTTYNPTISANSVNNASTTVTDPLGNVTVVTFCPPPSGSPCGWAPYETKRQIYDNANHLLRTIDTGYAAFPYKTSETTTEQNGLVTKTEWDYQTATRLYSVPGSGFPATSTTGPTGNVIEKREFAYGQGSAGPLLRKTDTAWGYATPGSPFNNRKTSDIVYDGSGNIVAQTTYEYDNYTQPLVASGATQHDSAFGTNYGTRGNLTATSRWLNSTNSWLTTRNQYDDTGNIVTTTDPGNHPTSFSYADSWNNNTCQPTGGNAAAYLTQVTNALGQTTKYKYNSCSGNLASSTDANSQTTSFTYDAMNRPLVTNYPDGGQTSYNYNGDPVPPHITKTVLATPDPSIVSDDYYDGLGHLTSTQLSDRQGTVTAATMYDGLGRASRVYNPTRCNPPMTNCGEATWGYTGYSYDPLGRTTLVTRQDGNTVQTDYSSFPVTVTTDETGRARKSITDGLGRVVEVDEPMDQIVTPPSSPAVAASGNVTITGQERFATIYTVCGPNGQTCPHNIPDGGIVSISVNGYSESYSYNSSDTPNTIAAALASAFYNDSAAPATASASGSIVYLQARTAGSVGNSYSLSASSYTQNTTYFPAGSTSFPISTSGASLTGGQDGQSGGPPYRVWNFSPGSVTLYNYDMLDNLTCSVQKGTDTAAFTTCSAAPSIWRPRSFSYDSLSRLLSASNPETGTITYGYGTDSACNPGGENLRTKTDARGVTTTYCYDALHRLQQKTFSNSTPALYFSYDVAPSWMTDLTNVKGRLVEADNQYAGSSGSIAAAFVNSYDAMGRVIRQWQQTPSTSPGGYFVYPAYDAAGNLKSLTYPSGRVINYQFDASAHLYKAYSTAGGEYDYLNVSQLWPTGAWQNATFGNGTRQQDSYSPRLQPTELKLLNNGNTSIADRQYVWTGCAEGMNNGNNGNVCGINDVLNSGRNQTYNFDALNRIVSGAENDGAFNQTMTYDVWGNASIAGPGGGSRSFNTKNQDTAYGFDAAGNLTNDGTFTYSYDAEERISSFTANSTGTQVANYVYDADGNRVRKNVGSGWTEYIYFGDNIIAETGPSGWTDYIFAGDKRVAQVSSSGTQYYWADHLGTTKMTLDASGNSQCYAIYTPFGSEVSGCPTHYKFTGKERDAEDGLDYFGARYYSSPMGRWMSPDWADKPEPVPYADLNDPQSLNLYGYVRNNPMSRADADGHCCDLSDVADFLTGASNAYGSDNVFGAGRMDQNTPAGKIGAAVGDFAATVTGGLETIAGGSEALVTAPAGATGVGIVVPAVGVAVAAHGATAAAEGFTHLFKSASDTDSGMKSGSAGGPGAGKKATPEQREQTLKENGGNCVVSGCNQPAEHADHAIPRSRDGDTTKENLQGMCAHHNCQKGAKTSAEYKQWRKDHPEAK